MQLTELQFVKKRDWKSGKITVVRGYEHPQATLEPAEQWWDDGCRPVSSSTVSDSDSSRGGRQSDSHNRPRPQQNQQRPSIQEGPDQEHGSSYEEGRPCKFRRSAGEAVRDGVQARRLAPELTDNRAVVVMRGNGQFALVRKQDLVVPASSQQSARSYFFPSSDELIVEARERVHLTLDQACVVTGPGTERGSLDQVVKRGDQGAIAFFLGPYDFLHEFTWTTYAWARRGRDDQLTEVSYDTGAPREMQLLEGKKKFRKLSLTEQELPFIVEAVTKDGVRFLVHGAAKYRIMPQHMGNMLRNFSDVPNMLGERIARAWKNQFVNHTSQAVKENSPSIRDAVNAADQPLKSREEEEASAVKIVAIDVLKIFSEVSEIDLAFDRANQKLVEEQSAHTVEVRRLQGDIEEEVERQKVPNYCGPRVDAVRPISSSLRHGRRL